MDATPIPPLPGPDGLYTVSVMPRFLADSARVGWAGAYFTDIVPASEGDVRHQHRMLGLQRARRPQRMRDIGRRGWVDTPAGFTAWSPGDEQHIQWAKGSPSQFLFVSPQRAMAVLGDVPRDPPPPLRRGGYVPAPFADAIFDALLADLALGSPAGAMVGDTLIATLLTHLHGPRREARTAAPLARGGHERVLALIESRFTEALTLDELAAEAGVGVRQFCRAFGARTGQSPHRFLLARRIEHAKDLIRRGEPLARVAVESGFADQAQFTRTFARLTGSTPGRYRREHAG